jgi:hypothetical protein
MAREKHRIVIEGGKARFVYSDELASLAKEGTVTRASHVEPHPTMPGWLADMRPSGGPILGLVEHALNVDPDEAWGDSWGIRSLQPFPTREAALDAERAWLRREKGL